MITSVYNCECCVYKMKYIYSSPECTTLTLITSIYSVVHITPNVELKIDKYIYNYKGQLSIQQFRDRIGLRMCTDMG